MEAQPQDHSAATKAPKLKRSHVEVNWEEWDASKVEARSRAMSYMVSLRNFESYSNQIIENHPHFPQLHLSIQL